MKVILLLQGLSEETFKFVNGGAQDTTLLHEGNNLLSILPRTNVLWSGRPQAVAYCHKKDKHEANANEDVANQVNKRLAGVG